MGLRERMSGLAQQFGLGHNSGDVAMQRLESDKFDLEAEETRRLADMQELHNLRLAVKVMTTTGRGSTQDAHLIDENLRKIRALCKELKVPLEIGEEE